jgi:hypothetical protein
MTVEQVMSSIGCSEQQARELLGYIAQTQPTIERGTWTVSAAAADFCPTCNRRTFHDDNGCISCRPRPERRRRTRKG